MDTPDDVGMENKGVVMLALQKKDYVVLLFGGVIFLLCSVMIFMQVPLTNAFCDIDSSAYLHSASLLYNYGTFSPAADPQAMPLYALGYSFFIALVYWLFGQSVYAIIGAQIALALFIGVVLFCTTRMLFGNAVARIAFLLFSCNLGFLVYAQCILSELLLIFLLLLFVNNSIHFLLEKKNRYLIGAGFWLVLSTLVKLVALYFIVVMLVGIALFCWINRIAMIKALLSFALPVSLIFIGFSYHNYLVFGQFRYSYNDNYNLYVVFHAQVLSLKDGGTREDQMRELTKTLHDPSSASYTELRCSFWALWEGEFGLFFKAWLINVSKIFLGLFTTQLKTLVNEDLRGGEVSFFKHTGSWFDRLDGYIRQGACAFWVVVVAWYEIIYSLLRYLFFLVGMVALLRERRWIIASFLGLYISYFSCAIAFDGTARYRFFFEFILLMLAAYGAYMVCMWQRDKKVIKKEKGVVL